MSVVLLGNSKAANLTKDYLSPRGYQPLYVGDDAAFRFQVLQGTTPVDLTGYTITAEFENTENENTLSRSSTITIPTTATLEISIDNQAVIGTDTGRGWYQLNFASVASEVSALTPLIGRCTFGIRITSGASVSTTHVTGAIDILTLTT